MKNTFGVIIVSVIAGCAAGAITTALMWSHYADHLKAREIELIDASGSTRATLGVSQDQTASLQFFSPNHVRQLSMGVVQQGQQIGKDFESSLPRIELDDETGRKSAVLSSTGNGNSRLDFLGVGEKWHMGLGYITDGSDVAPAPKVWGIRISAVDVQTTYGIFAQPSHNGTQFLAPILDSFGTRAGYQYPSYISPVMRANPGLTKQIANSFTKEVSK